ncbi:MAG TPA: V-type ATP synthase subunit F [Candidatus Methanofastidiosa archaeon]|nr:V-type ATP synthase subunit F [Candidatus Methanofastidiosa archaeon]
MEMVLLGDDSFTVGFRLAGVKRNVPCYSEEDYSNSLTELLDDPSVGIVVLSHDAMANLPLSLRIRAEKSISPIVFPVGEKGSEDIKNQIIKLIGVDLWK